MGRGQLFSIDLQFGVLCIVFVIASSVMIYDELVYKTNLYASNFQQFREANLAASRIVNNPDYYTAGAKATTHMIDLAKTQQMCQQLQDFSAKTGYKFRLELKNEKDESIQIKDAKGDIRNFCGSDAGDNDAVVIKRMVGIPSK